MKLSSTELLDTLIERRLLPPAVVVDGAVQVVDTSRRNHDRRVERGDGGPGWFVKQPALEEASRRASLVREASCYEQFRPGGVLAALAPHTLTCPGFDPQSGLLVLELMDPAVDLGQTLRERGDLPAGWAAAAGRIAAALAGHGPSVATAQGRLSLPGGLPWCLSIAHTPAQAIPDSSPAQTTWLGAVAGEVRFAAPLQTAIAHWERAALLHGDLKWDNWLAAPDGSRLVLVDWELADLGDPAFDLASLLVSTVTQAALRVGAGVPFAQACAALPRLNGELWQSCAGSNPWCAAAPARFRGQLRRLLLARLLQSGFELCHGQSTVPAAAQWLFTLAQAQAVDLRAADGWWFGPAAAGFGWEG
jgi:hypothetical protein